MDNLDVLVKDALGTGDFKTAGGYLNAEQSSKFIQGVIDQPTIIKEARTVQIIGENKKIEKIGFGSRILRPGIENTALTKEQYAKPSFGKVDLNTKEVIAEVRLSYDTLEANIEGEGLKNTIISMIQNRVALDLEELVIQGDTDSNDGYLAIFNGLLKLCATHVTDAKGAEPALNLFTSLIKSVPDKYIRDMNAWGMYTSRNVDLAWKEAIAARNTVAGDRFLLQNTLATALGFNIKPIAMMPENLTYGFTPVNGLGQILLMHPKNLIVGFTRSVQMEMDKDISARQYIIVCTMKVGVAVEETDAVGKLINIAPLYTPAV